MDSAGKNGGGLGSWEYGKRSKGAAAPRTLALFLCSLSVAISALLSTTASNFQSRCRSRVQRRLRRLDARGARRGVRRLVPTRRRLRRDVGGSPTGRSDAHLVCDNYG